MNGKFSTLVFVLVSLFCFGFVLAEPFGAQVTPGDTSRADIDETAGNHSAFAGNVTELTIFGFSITNTWQGYFGNVSGAITLSNSAGNAMYNWTFASPNGQVYASVNETINWSSLVCYDLANVADLESAYNVPSSAGDGVDETFNLNNHAAFSAAGNDFSGGDCNNTQLFNDAGVGTFDVVLLEDTDAKVIFTSLLSQDTTGFDGNSYDFQMIVLEDGRGNTDTTPYYFWVELE
jgi:hypothetical protein